MAITKSEWGFKKQLREILQGVSVEDFPYFPKSEGLNPRIYCGEGMPKKDVDFTSAF